MAVCGAQHAFCLPCGGEAHGPCGCNDWQRWYVPTPYSICTYSYGYPNYSSFSLSIFSVSHSFPHTKSLCCSFDLSLSLFFSTSFVSVFLCLALSFTLSLYITFTLTLSLSHSLSLSLFLSLSISLSLSLSLFLSLRQKKLVDEMKAAGAMPGGSQVSQLLSILIFFLFGFHFFRIAL